MPSTYTVNLGIEKPATGEQSGTWGDTVNDNSNILDEAVNGVVSITLSSAGSSGSPNQIAITNGASSTGRNKWIEFADGGDLGAAAYVELIPNDAEKICFIRNSLAGSRSIFLFQGTYSTSNDLEIAAGTDVLVKFNGGGTGATVVNVNANLAVNGIDVAGLVEFNSLSGTGAVAITDILDQDNMSGNSATALATQQSIKAYVDAQVDTVDTLAEVLAIGNTSGGTDVELTTTDKVQFRDAAIYLNSSVDGQLDIVADTEIQLVATTVDLNGALDVSGTVTATGTSVFASLDISGDIDVDGTANLDVVDIDGATQADGTITVGVDGTGYDVKFFGATSGAYMLWDESADDLKLVGAAGLTVAGDIDVDGTTNLDAVDIDGAVQLDSTLSVGVDGTGHDVKFFGDTASAYMLWDQSTDDLILGGASRLGVGTTTPAAPLNVKVSADGTLVRLSRHGVCDWDVSIGNTSTLSGVGAGALEFLPQNGGTPNEFAIGKAGTTTAIFHATVDGITMPLQPAFNAYPASVQSNIAINTAVTVVLGTEAFDVGANFASNTFTAPVTGKYQLNVLLQIDSLDLDASLYQLQIITSNKSYNLTLSPGSFDADVTYWGITNSVLADMDASDTAVVKIYQAGGAAQADISVDTNFSGFLAC